MSDILFSSACAPARPIRLSEEVRRWAYESLEGKYGDEARRWDAVSMDDIPNFDALPALEQYDLCIERIARQAPLRHVPGEPVSGSATLGLGIDHMVPARCHGKPVLESVSHLTVNFERVVAEGIDARHELVQKQLKQPALEPEARRFLESADRCLRAMRVYHQRCLDALETQCPENAALLRQVPFGPARTFREAVQSVWFTFAFLRLCGNWPGIGRLDKMLNPFLKRELQAGSITMDEARTVLAGFFIKGCEWILSNRAPGSGDAQHYQNLVLAGIDEDGHEVAGPATELILDVVEELPIGDFPITIRLSEQTPAWLREKAARVIRHGGGVVAFYNEQLILDALTHFGYAEREARNFANDGCWEVQIPGKTHFRYVPFDSLQILLKDTLHLDAQPAHFDNYASLREAFAQCLSAQVERICLNVRNERFERDESGTWQHKRHPQNPSTVIALFEDGCLERARDYRDGGPDYEVVSPHIGGAPDVGNSLYAIDRLCFRERRVSFDELMRILKDNWANQEALRQYVLRRYTYYGNDCDESDTYTADVLNLFADCVARFDGLLPLRFAAGVSTFGRQIEWASRRMATPFGRKAGELLSGNISPTPGTDLAGATAVIASACKMPMARLVNGAALDLRMAPSAVSGENGLQALISLTDGFCRLGGYFLQPDVTDAETLRRAQDNPEDYRTLSVRVSGWNARFITLDRNWQQMIIEKTEHGV